MIGILSYVMIVVKVYLGIQKYFHSESFSSFLDRRNVDYFHYNGYWISSISGRSDLSILWSGFSMAKRLSIITFVVDKEFA